MPIVNGVSVSIELLVEELRARSHSVHIFTAGRRKHTDTDPNIHRFPSVELPFAPGYALAFPPFYPMLKGFRRHEFDLIHTHTPYTIGSVGLRWAESHGLPIVSTYHTLYQRYAHYIPFFPKWYVRYKIAKHTNYYYNRCDRVIAPSEAALSSLRRHSVKRPISVIPTGNPAAVRGSKTQAREATGARDGDRILLYVGRIAKEKNLSVLFEAVQRVMQEKDDVRLWLVGDGPYRKECQKMARELGIGDRVRFTGMIPRAEVEKYYMVADIFVFSSVTETQGLVIGEAMAHGVPAVAVRGGGASAAIENDVNGYVVGNSSAQFSETVLRILNNPSLHGRISEGARRSVKLWTSGDACEEVLKVYSTALGVEAPQYAVVEDARHADASARAN